MRFFCSPNNRTGTNGTDLHACGLESCPTDWKRLTGHTGLSVIHVFEVRNIQQPEDTIVLETRWVSGFDNETRVQSKARRDLEPVKSQILWARSGP